MCAPSMIMPKSRADFLLATNKPHLETKETNLQCAKLGKRRQPEVESEDKISCQDIFGLHTLSQRKSYRRNTKVPQAHLAVCTIVTNAV